MGAVAAEANDFWARVQTGENQPLPDTKARVRFLLDEIALLQTRFDTRKQFHHEEPLQLQEVFPELKDSEFVENVPEASFIEAPELKDSEFVENVPEAAFIEAPVKELVPWSDEAPGASLIPVHTRCDEFLQFIEEKLHTLVDERSRFFETAETELRIGKVERPELAQLLRVEKSKLQRHRVELDAYRGEWSCRRDEDTTRNSDSLWRAVQAIIDKFVRLLEEREGLQLKLEVQVELGHFFRLLKLLEVQKAKDESSRRELESNIQELRELVERSRVEAADDRCIEEDHDGELQPADDTEDDDAQEDSIESSSSGDRDIEPMIIMRGSGDASTSYADCKKEAKQEIQNLMAEQEQRWKEQLSVLREMEHRLACSELEAQRLSSILKEGCHCECRSKPEPASITAEIPQGYSSIYFSPIFQERKANLRSQRDDREAELQKLRNEVSHLKEALSIQEKKVLDWSPNPPEEKTILVDAACNPDPEQESFFASESLDSVVGNSTLSEGDKKFCESAVQRMFLIIQQNRNELKSSNLQSGVEQGFVEVFRRMSAQFHELSEDLRVHFKVGGAPEDAQGGALRVEMDRLASEHARELGRKEKTLEYAQELNLQMANDMSRTENSLAELRMELVAVKLSLETRLKTSQNEADALAERLRGEIATLEAKLKEKDRALQESTSRAEACQRETDAAVLEKKSFLERLQRAQSEVEEQILKTQRLEQEITQSKQDAEGCGEISSQLHEAREELMRAGDAREALERRYSELQGKLFETEYELAQREAALERLTLHLAASTSFQEGSLQEASSVSLRSKHQKKEQARKSIQEAEEKMLEIASEMAKAKSEMEDMKSQSFQLLRKLRMK